MKRFAPILLVLWALARAAVGQNIDMSTLPERDSVQLTIYNAEDLTLVRETRHITVRKGENQLQFSWANTLIDPSSVLLRFPDRDRGLEVIDTRLPFDRPQVLYWTVQASFDGQAIAEISYFTSGISWAADYVGMVHVDEKGMALEGFVTITNGSGEDYENASVRMVVGTINLVERIAELARRGTVPGDPGHAGATHEDLSRTQALRSELEAGSKYRFGGGSGGLAEDKADRKEIVKEGLSEYFIFTVPGEETVRNGWSKRMRLFAPDEGKKVPFRIEYRYRPQEYGEELVRMFLVRNDTASTLGTSPLPDGAVRLFRRTSDDGLSVLAFLQTKYVPIGQEFEFNLGRDPQVILERLVMERSRDEFWFRRGNDEKLLSPTKGDRIDPSYAMAGWDDHAKRVERVRNYRGEAITVAWRFGLDGDVRFVSALSPTLFDYRTPEFTTSVAAGETKDLGYEVIARQGTNAKQSHVELVNR
ncbi:MAG: hypothetical protein JNL80_10430 [Phycisphaerae bacterium]|nr:hypothetical protein [Phycisphaerae bacterium]